MYLCFGEGNLHIFLKYLIKLVMIVVFIDLRSQILTNNITMFSVLLLIKTELIVFLILKIFVSYISDMFN